MDKQSPAVRAALAAIAALDPANDNTPSPWERLRISLLWWGFIGWLREDLHNA